MCSLPDLCTHLCIFIIDGLASPPIFTEFRSAGFFHLCVFEGGDDVLEQVPERRALRHLSCKKTVNQEIMGRFRQIEQYAEPESH